MDRHGATDRRPLADGAPADVTRRAVATGRPRNAPYGIHTGIAASLLVQAAVEPFGFPARRRLPELAAPMRPRASRQAPGSAPPPARNTSSCAAKARWYAGLARARST